MTKSIIPLVLFCTFLSCATKKPSMRDYWAIPADLTKVTYEGGDGKDVQNPVVIKNAENSRNGITAEYAFISKIHGEKFKTWKPVGHSTFDKDGRKIDSISIQLLENNETITYYFDITDFYGKWD